MVIGAREQIETVPRSATADQVNAMLRNLPADRFKPYFEDPNEPIHEPGKPAFDKNGGMVLKPGGFGFVTGPGQRQLLGRKRSIEQLALILANELGRPVVDKTGLTEYYDYTVKYAPNLTPVQTDGGYGGPAGCRWRSTDAHGKLNAGLSLIAGLPRAFSDNFRRPTIHSATSG
jgi:hypothetical protein